MPLAFLPMICSRTALASSTKLPFKGEPDWQVELFSSEQALRQDWPVPKRTDSFWLQPEVLAFLRNQPQGLETKALLLLNTRDQRKVLLTAQTFYFNAGGQVSDDAKGETSAYDFRRRLLAPFSFKVLALGQFLVSGNYASEGLDQLSTPEAARVLPALANTLMAKCHAYAGVLLKDLYPTLHPATQELQSNGFYLLPADPIMEVEIPTHWEGMDDYLQDLKSKYRVRYRRARAKLAGVSHRVLTPPEVARYRDRIFELYATTMSGADFNAASLTPAYFPWLSSLSMATNQKLSLVTTADELLPLEAAHWHTQLQGYFNTDGELIGFTSAIRNGATMHAHFLGMEESYKHSHHLYHNMLFDLLEEAIRGGFKILDYARTAPEIKSSVGANAVDYACLIKVRPWLVSKLLPVFVPAVYTATDWVPRNPFPERQRALQ